jgi:hypothetical protein
MPLKIYFIIVADFFCRPEFEKKYFSYGLGFGLPNNNTFVAVLF